MDTNRDQHGPQGGRAEDGGRPITWSPSVTVTLTHDCPWHCRYCGFRTDAEGLIGGESIRRILDQGAGQGAREALLIAGEHPGTLPHIRRELEARGCADFTEFAILVARQVVDAGLLPHGNYGALSPSQFARLRPWHVSMGVMLEQVDDLPAIAPEKKAAGRLATIAEAGRQKIPFTSGILIGLGESGAGRLRSLDALAELHRRYGHLQEILIQNFVPNPGSDPALAANPPPPLEDYLGLIAAWRERCPDVPVQIPPNLNPHWRELLPWIDDLGGISAERDEVNPTRPWAPPAEYRRAAAAAGRPLRPRWAVYDRFLTPEWVEPSLLRRIHGGTGLAG